jgi:hypothetical protein
MEINMDKLAFFVLYLINAHFLMFDSDIHASCPEKLKAIFEKVGTIDADEGTGGTLARTSEVMNRMP